jgi:hypothetical protein
MQVQIMRTCSYSMEKFPLYVCGVSPSPCGGLPVVLHSCNLVKVITLINTSLVLYQAGVFILPCPETLSHCSFVAKHYLNKGLASHYTLIYRINPVSFSRKSVKIQHLHKQCVQGQPFLGNFLGRRLSAIMVPMPRPALPWELLREGVVS